MKRELSKAKEPDLYYFVDGVKKQGLNLNLIGDCTDLRGDCTDLCGDCTDLCGDCTDLCGDCTDLCGDCTYLTGNIDDCEITPAERSKGIAIRDLIQGAK